MQGQEQQESATTETVKKKRGRKPSKERKGYFYEEQEKAVVDYITATDMAEKNRIFNETLKPAFTKMVESIIRRYNLYPPDEEFKETFDDTISFLMTKLPLFDPTTKFKAYSYCGTICKNYLIYKINKFAKNQKRNQSYDNPYENISVEIDDSIKYSYNEEEIGLGFIERLTGATLAHIHEMLQDKEEFGLTENEIKVGEALSSLMENWNDLFAQMGSNKFNKSSILLYIKELTSLSPKEVRESLKVFKEGYFATKKRIINE